MAKIIPIRGYVEDWSSKNFDKLLKEKLDYSKRMMKRQAEGSPDFSVLLKLR